MDDIPVVLCDELPYIGDPSCHNQWWQLRAAPIHSGGKTQAMFHRAYPSLVWPNLRAYIHIVVQSWQGVKLILECRAHYPVFDVGTDDQIAHVLEFTNDQLDLARAAALEWLPQADLWMQQKIEEAGWVNRPWVTFQVGKLAATLLKQNLGRLGSWANWPAPDLVELPDFPPTYELIKKLEGWGHQLANQTLAETEAWVQQANNLARACDEQLLCECPAPELWGEHKPGPELRRLMAAYFQVAQGKLTPTDKRPASPRQLTLPI